MKRAQAGRVGGTHEGQQLAHPIEAAETGSRPFTDAAPRGATFRAAGMKREPGFALILVIWSLVVLSGLATGFVMGTRHETRLAQGVVQELEIEAAVTRAINLTLLAMTRRDPESRWTADGTPHAIPWRGPGTLQVRVRSEGAKIDINQAPRELIEGIIREKLPGLPAGSLTDALIDWRDADQEPLPEGAEADDYLALGRQAIPTNQPFDSIQELSRVVGFDPAAIATLQPHITTLSGRATVDASSARLSTLLAIPGIAPGDAQSFVQQRDNIEPVPGPLPFALLDAGSRYLDKTIHNEIVSVDIEVSLENGSTQTQQIIARLGPDNRYRVISRGSPEIQPSPGR